MKLANNKFELDEVTGLMTGVNHTPENIVNKVTSFDILNDTLYPTTKAVDTHLIENIAALTAYFFYNVASDIGGYLQMKQPASAGVLQTLDFPTVTNGLLLATFATNLGSPNITFLPNGIVKLNIHADSCEFSSW